MEIEEREGQLKRKLYDMEMEQSAIKKTQELLREEKTKLSRKWKEMEELLDQRETELEKKHRQLLEYDINNGNTR